VSASCLATAYFGLLLKAKSERRSSSRSPHHRNRQLTHSLTAAHHIRHTLSTSKFPTQQQMQSTDQELTKPVRSFQEKK